MSDSAITFAIVGVVVVLFVWNRIPVALVALGTALSLYFTGVLDLRQALGGLGDSVVVFIAALFVVSAGLETTGVTAWAGQLVVAQAGQSRVRLLVLISLTSALLTAVITPNGAVAALLPVVVVIAVRLNRSPSQLLMPFVFSSHAGSMLALTGTPVSVLVSEVAAKSAGGAFGFFEFGIVGIPLLAGTIAIIVLFGARLLPHRRGKSIPADLSRHARTLVEQYRLDEGVFQLRLRGGSPWVGAAPSAVDLAAYPGLTLLGIQAADTGGPPRRPALAEGDLVLVRGEAEAAAQLAADKTLAFRSGEAAAGPEALFTRTSGLAEVVIPPRSGLIGRPVFPGMVTESGDLVILAVQRRGEDMGPGETALAAGDSLLLQGTWRALDEHLDDPDVLVVDSPEVVRRQAVPMGAGAYTAIAVLLLMVAALATGAVPSVVAALVAACAMVLLRVVTIEQAYRSVNWTTVILVGAMIPLSTAMTQSGAAAQLAEGVVRAVGGAGPYALLAGFFLLTAILGQLISNMATAIIVIPIAVAAALDMGISPRPMLMAVNVAAAGALLTPVATPVNLMVMGPGGYTFTSYAKFGLPILIWYFLVAVFYVPLFWRF
jgi:di/tricarboxylate transporter